MMMDFNNMYRKKYFSQNNSLLLAIGFVSFVQLRDVQYMLLIRVRKVVRGKGELIFRFYRSRATIARE